MFIFDVETLGTSSSSVILSMACIYFDPNKKPSYQDLLDSAFFVKFDAKEQINRYNRTVSKSTLEWWDKQSEGLKIQSLKPSISDVSAEVGITLFNEWVKRYPDYKKSTVWARGNLDQIVLNSLENDVKIEPILPFWLWRDVRTAVDLLYGSNTGYCEVKYPGFDVRKVIKHNPIEDCAFDAMMLMYGVNNNEVN